MSNIASLVGASLGAYVLAIVTLNLFGPFFGLDRWYAPLLWTLIANNLALAAVIIFTEQRDKTEESLSSRRRAAAVFIFLNSTGALVTTVSNLVESLETNEASSNALTLISQSLLFQDFDFGLYVYFSSFIAIGALSLVVQGVGYVSDPNSGAAPSDLGGISSALLTISLVTDSVWKPVPFESEQAVEIWTIALALGGLAIASFAAVVFGRLAFIGIFSLSSIFLHGALHVGQQITSKKFLEAAALFLRATLNGILVATGIAAAAVFVAISIPLLLEQTRLLSFQTIELLFKGAMFGVTAVWLALPAIALVLSGFVCTWTALRFGPLVTCSVWSLLKSTFRALVRLCTALLHLIQAILNAILWIARRLAKARVDVAPVNDALRKARSDLWLSLTPVMRFWRAGYPAISRTAPVVALATACIALVTRSSELSFSLQPKIDSIAEQRVEPTDLSAIPVGSTEAPISPVQTKPPVEEVRPKLRSLTFDVVSTCTPRVRTLSWANGSEDSLDVPLDSCAMPLQVLQAEQGAIVLIAAASTSDFSDRESARADRRAVALAKWAEEQVSSDVRILVLNLGMATRSTSFRFLSFTLAPATGSRPALVLLFSPDPSNATVASGDVAKRIMQEFRDESLIDYFTKCDLLTYSKNYTGALEGHRVEEFSCALSPSP